VINNCKQLLLMRNKWWNWTCCTYRRSNKK